MKLWIAVTADRLELPIAIERTAIELAKTMETTVSNIRSKKCRGECGKRCGYRVVTVEDE